MEIKIRLETGDSNIKEYQRSNIKNQNLENKFMPLKRGKSNFFTSQGTASDGVRLSCDKNYVTEFNKKTIHIFTRDTYKN